MTRDEARSQIIVAARSAVDYWTHRVAADLSCAERVDGAMFTFLTALDGMHDHGLPSCDIVLVHEDDDGNLLGETRVSAMLHEHYYPS